MNLSTAGASKRAKEVGIRKVLGSLKQSLVGQFMAESFLFTSISLLISVIMVICVIPLFNDIIGKDLDLSWSDAVWILPGLLLVGLIVGVFAGSYPAFFLSSFQPISVLKGKFSSGTKSLSLRSGLVVFQFFISITLIMGTIVVYSQLQFIRNKKLGFDKDQLIVVENTWRLGNREQSFIKQLSSDPRIASSTVSGYLPAGSSFNNNYTVSPEGNETQLVKTLRYDVDYEYLKTMGMQMATGRFFSREFGTDSSGVIINEAAAKVFGWADGAMGKRIVNSDNNGNKKIFTIIGVVKDFHFKSLHQKISPLVMTLGDNNGTVILRTKTKDMAGLISSLKKQWDSLDPEAPFAYSFMDERVEQTYQYEQKVSKVLTIFASLTIFIACLGLFGLARFSIEQRTKEIGIRKVLGASVMIILNLITRDFLKLVIIASLIALPISWYVMNFWLQDYEYRINIQWWMFGIPGLFAVLISIATISFEAIKSAVMNPVKSLRSE
jgi:putative ABC transport system permease protein